MAEAIASGLLHSEEPDFKILISEPLDTRKKILKEKLPEIHLVDNNLKLFEQKPDAVILAVKPQVMEKMLLEIADASEGSLLISIAAGIPLQQIQSICKQSRCVRIMPNTPFLVQQGCGGIAFDKSVTSEDQNLVLRIFQQLGKMIVIEEEKMDAVTALSGSGPAYFFYFVEQMVDAAVSEGLTRAEAEMLAAQTLLGAGKLLVNSDCSAEELRVKVTSPHGTTESALKEMMNKQVGDGIKKGLKAAADRSRELSKP